MQKRQPSILFIWNKDVRNPTAGGGTWELQRQMEWLAERGYKITQLAGNYKGGAKTEQIHGVTVIRVGSIYTMPLILVLLQLRKRILDNYDVVVEAQGYLPYFVPIMTTKPVIVICQHLPKEIYTIEGPELFGRPLGYVLGAVARFIESVVTPRVYREIPTFTFSESSRLDLIQTGFREVRSVPYALAQATFNRGSVETFRPKLGRLDYKKTIEPTLVCIGRLRKYKGVQDVIKAVSLVRDVIPNIRLYVVGRGEYESKLKALTSKLDLGQCVDFTGYVSVEKKFELISSSHLLIMPSYREGWATPVLEAQMCGTASVVSDAVGVRDLVEEGVTGLTYPKGDCKALAHQILRLLKNQELRESMERNGRGHFREIDWKNNEETFLKLFEAELNDMILKAP